MASAKVTFDATPEVKALMDAHPEVNWSQVLRDAVRRYARAQEIARQLLDEEEDPRIQAVAALLKQSSGERWREAVADARRP